VSTIHPSPLRRVWTRLLRLGFRLLYNEMAFTYDTVSRLVSLGQWRDWQRAALDHLDAPSGAPVLELAHGTGDLAIDLLAAGFQPVGVDLSRAMGRIARHKLQGHALPTRLVRARAQALPFAANTFPAAVSTFPTEFIVDPATLAEAWRVLVPGGRLVIVVNGLLTRRGVAEEALELAYRATGQRGPWSSDIEDRFARAGFAFARIDHPLDRSVVSLIVASKPVTE
jgi:ubiquinone/menaquinone biosynthesis C-methylase UbiE